jgi:hypothetical protein
VHVLSTSLHIVIVYFWNMRILSALIAVVALAGFGRSEEAAESDVVVLTNDNFDDFLKENKYVLAEFYAPWSLQGPCAPL